MRKETTGEEKPERFNKPGKIQKSDPFLSNHMVFEKGIYPAVAYLKLVIDSLEEMEPGCTAESPLKITDVSWNHPLIVEEKREKSISIGFKRDGNKLEYRVTGKKGKEDVIYTSGTITAIDNKIKRERKIYPLEKIARGPGKKIDQSKIYPLFAETGITYKGIFQCLEQLQLGKNESSGTISCPPGHHDTGRLNPGIMDAVMQTILMTVFKKRKDKKVFVPFSLREIVVWETRLPANCYAHAAVVDLNKDKEFARFNAALLDEKGMPLLEIADLCVKAFPGPDSEAGQAKEKNKLAVAASFTAEPISDFLSFWMEKLKMKTEIHFAPYNQIFQELLNPGCLLSTNQAGINLILLRVEDFARQVQKETVEISGGLKETLFEGKETLLLPNQLEIAHLNEYETRYLYREIFEEQTYLKNNIQLQDGDVVIDIGANIGMFSLFVTSRCKDAKLFSFEPSPVTFDILKTNLEVHAPNAVPCNCGVSGENTTAEFTFYPHSSVFSGFHADDSRDEQAIRTVIENAIKEKGLLQDETSIKEYARQLMESRLLKQTYTCELKTLSTIFKGYGIDRVNLLKVDAEKCEWEILMGIDPGDWDKIKQIVIEVHDSVGELYKKVRGLLEEKGFQLEVVEEKLLEGSGLFNIYGKRPVTGSSRFESRFREEVERNIKDLTSILKSTAEKAKVPYLLCLCPASPVLENSAHQPFLTSMAQFMMDELKGAGNIYVLNISDFRSIYSFDNYYDEHRDRMGHIPYTQEFFATLAAIAARRIYALNSKPYKVVILDCDNTLWKGVCGEVGAGGVEISPAFQYLQQFMVKQKDSGVLICLASKNQEEDVKKVFEERDDMILKWDRITAAKINWQRKSENIQALARELNLGLDSFIFIDDNPVECAEVKAGCPEVLTLQLPEEDKIKDFLDHIWAFDHWEVTVDDRKRAESYKQEQKRQEFQESTVNFKDFIEKLNLDIRVTPAEPTHYPRVSQLTFRTNQFNFTTIRRKEPEIKTLVDSGEFSCYVAHVSDRFGDYGLVGVFILEEEKDDLLVDTFLLSCRVLGRGAAHRMLAEIGKIAKEKAKKQVIARYIPTEKNEPAKNFLMEVGAKYQKESEGETHFIFPVDYLAKLTFEPPEAGVDKSKKKKKAKKSSTTGAVADKSIFFNEIACQLRDPGHLLDAARKKMKTKAHGDLPARREKEQESGNQAVLNHSDLEIKKFIEKEVVSSAAKVIGVVQEEIDPGMSFKDMGIKSMEGITLLAGLNNTFDIVLPVTVLFDYSCAVDLAGFIFKNHEKAIVNKFPFPGQDQEGVIVDSPPGAEKELTPGTAGESVDAEPIIRREERKGSKNIAIIGISGRFPGASGIDEFWMMLSWGKSAVTRVPEERWHVNDYYDPDPACPGKTNCKWGGFLEDIDKFDPLFFNISGKEAINTDPQQRLFLEECWKALEDAGYANQCLANTRCGIFVGAGPGDYREKMRTSGVPIDDSSIFTGNHPSILASRLSYFLNLKGPSMAIDTACSSSLVAIHMACENIISGGSEMALAGGVFINTTPEFHILASKANMLSPVGKCKAFDDEADGFVPGEGVGVVVLKSLEAAERDNDHIYGIIRGSSINQDGKTNGIMAPSTLSQTELEVETYKKAGINPGIITYVETHGTGTKLGDPIEIEALTNAFKQFTSRKQYCAVGSVKTNIGHAASAAGVAGLIKVLLCLKYGKLISSLNFKKGNQYINFKDSPFFVNTELNDWVPVDSKPRLAAVSSFGFSGTNCHMVVEEYKKTGASLKTPETRGRHIFILSARNEDRLRIYARKMVEFLEKVEPFCASGEVEEGYSFDNIKSRLQETAAGILKVPKEDIDPEDDLREYGFEPISLAELSERLNETYHVDVSQNIFSDYPSINSLAQYLYHCKAYPQTPNGEPPVPISLSDICYTLQVGREAMVERLAAVVTNIKELKEKLLQFCKGSSGIKNFYRGNFKQNKAISELLEGGSAGEEFIRTLAKEQEFSRLAQLWVLGIEIDWQLLYTKPVRKPGRVSLPSYPFSPECYWIVESDSPGTSRALTGDEGQDKYQIVSPPVKVPGTIYFQSIWKEVEFPLSPQDLKNNLPAIVLFFDINEELKETYIEASKQRTGTFSPVILVKPGNRFRHTGNGIYEINPASRADYQKLVEMLLVSYPVQEKNLHIIHRWSQEVFSPDEKALKAQLHRGVYSVFFLSQALMTAPQKIKSKIRLVYMYPGFRHDPQPQYAGLSGFARVIRLENPRFSVKTLCLSVPPGEEIVKMTASQLLEILNKEFGTWGEEIEIKYVPGDENNGVRRYVKGFEKMGAVEKSSLPGGLPGETVKLKDRGVYLITGGLGGLGMIFAEFLARRAQAKLLLSDLSEPDAEQTARFRKLESLGAEVAYIKTDIASYENVKDLVKSAAARFKQINGVIHCAGLIRDAFILKKTREEMDAVLAPKVYGTIYLDEALKEENLDFFVMFSSITAVLGNAGQSDYAYANSFMDYFAERREQLRKEQKRHGRTITINWTLWKDGGMRITGPEQASLFERTGLAPLPTEEGLKTLEFSFQSPGLQYIAAYGNCEKIEKILDHPFYLQDVQDLNTIENIDPKDQYRQPAGEPDRDELFEKIQGYLKKVFAEILKFPVSRIDPEARFEELGIDSIIINTFNSKIEKELCTIPKTLLFEYQTLRELAGYFIENHKIELIRFFNLLTGPSPVVYPVEETVKETPVIHIPGELAASHSDIPGGQKDIAIIGISGRYPKAQDIKEFWENLKSGKDCIGEVPVERWDYRGYYNPEPGKGKIYSKWGAFLEDVDLFDPLFFNISPREAEMIDPQERIFLETVWEAVEDAGYTGRELIRHFGKEKGADVGVFAGVTSYTYNLLGAQDGEIWYVPYSWSIANRVSFIFNFRGPSMPVDTACSSSLTAIHMACESLNKGECQLAIAGGVNLILHPAKYVEMCTLGMLSPTGRCNTFGVEADGFVPGEGVGVVLLKPLSTAIRDRDHIYAVIKSSSINHGGRTNGYTVPSPNAQADLILQALKKSGLDPGTISYVEAHGTGTALGDPIEIQGLTKAYRKYTREKQYCAIGSVKSNIGHLESAAGIAGLTKVILQFKHKQLVPSIHAEKLNPKIDFENSPFYVQQELSEWKQPAAVENGIEKSCPRRAGISSFGAGGANAHIIVEEYNEEAVTPHLQHVQHVQPREKQVVLLSTKHKDQLRIYAARLLDFIENIHPLSKEYTRDSQPFAPGLSDIAYTLQVGREHMEQRIAVVVSDTGELKDKLTLFCRSEPGADIEIENFYHGNVNPGKYKEEARLLVEGEEGEGYIRSIIEKGKLNKIAQLWTAGVDIDWKLLYPAGTPKRISLPTYPFSRERYWLPEPNRQPVIKKEEQGQFNRLHPMLDRNTSDLNGLRFTTQLQGNEFYLRNYISGKQKVLPCLACLEMARAAGEIAGKTKVQKVKDIQWGNPIILEGKTCEIHVSLYPQADQDAVEFEISTNGKGKGIFVHTQGRLVYEEHSNNQSIHNNMIDIEAIKRRCAAGNEADCCARLQQIVSNQGFPARLILKFYCNGRESLTQLMIPEEFREGNDKFQIHPLLMEGTFLGAVGLLTAHNTNDDFYPFALKELELLKPISQKCYAYITLTDNGYPDEGIRDFDIQLADEDGQVLVIMKNLTLKKLEHPGTLLESIDNEYEMMQVLTQLKTGTLDVHEANLLIENLGV